MKRKVTLSVLVILFFVLKLNSQLLTPYLAKDEFEAAKKSALDSGMVNPELIGVGTAPGSYQISDQLPNVTISFDLTNGKATAWLYLFHSASDTSKQAAIVVAKTIFGTIALQMPLNQFGNLPGMTSDGLDLSKYINSDKMVENLNQNNDYKNFMKDASSSLQLIGLYFNKINPLLPLNKALYAISFTSAAGDMLCSVEAISGTVKCRTFTDVPYLPIEPSTFNVFPNPASKELYIEIPSDLQSVNSSLRIYDSFGEIVTEIYNFPKNGDLEHVSLSLDNFSNGMYFLRYVTNGQTYSSQFVIEK